MLFQVGFFVEIGPLGNYKCFVSKHRLPLGYKFNPSCVPPSWESSNDNITEAPISPNTKVRIKVEGVAMRQKDINCVASMQGPHLGPCINDDVHDEDIGGADL
eukprot:GHVL01035396.1.p2 GENE.GHVL01035396.1~~GHVL01035396.1.p2  ORF type:complete len:103 (+),score=18.43 GHVL01035396.1:106-414(+)